jgi:hypothetical protein
LHHIGHWLPHPKTKTKDNNYFEISRGGFYIHFLSHGNSGHNDHVQLFEGASTHVVKSTNMNSFKFQMHKFSTKGSGNGRARANTAYCVVPNNIHLNKSGLIPTGNWDEL